MSRCVQTCGARVTQTHTRTHATRVESDLLLSPGDHKGICAHLCVPAQSSPTDRSRVLDIDLW